MFVNTFRGQGDTIITVKPPIHYIFFTIPIVKYLLLKDSRTMAVFFCSNLRKDSHTFIINYSFAKSKFYSSNAKITL